MLLAVGWVFFVFCCWRNRQLSFPAIYTTRYKQIKQPVRVFFRYENTHVLFLVLLILFLKFCLLCFVLRWLKQATFFSGLSPVAAVDVHRSLDRACQNLVVATELHALYLLTPLDGLEPDWGRFREEYTAWREEDPARIVGKAVSRCRGIVPFTFGVDTEIEIA